MTSGMRMDSSGARQLRSVSRPAFENRYGAWAAGGAVLATGLVGLTVFADDNDVDYKAVEEDIKALIESAGNYDDGSYGPLFIRLAWHSAGNYSKHDNTGGTNGATMRYAPESNHGGNAGLHIARDLLEVIK